MTLPTPIVSALQLTRESRGSAELADGSVRKFASCAAEVDWGGDWRRVLVSEVGDEILLGVQLLADQELRSAVVPGGLVEIGPLSGSA